MGRIVKYFKRKLHERAIKFVRENFDYIDDDKLAISHGYHNNACHWNAYTDYRSDTKNTKLIATMCISPSYKHIFTHFINYNVEADKYYDLTLGACNIIYYYQYVIGECDLSDKEIEDMNERLYELKHWIIDRSFKNKYIRKFYYWLEDKYGVI